MVFFQPLKSAEPVIVVLAIQSVRLHSNYIAVNIDMVIRAAQQMNIFDEE